MRNLIFTSIAIFSFIGFSYGQDFDEIGKKHNQYLKIILQNFDESVNSKNVYEKTVQIIESKILDGNADLHRYESYEPYSMLDELEGMGAISSKLSSQMRNDIDAIKNAESYDQIWSFVEQAKKNARTLPVEDVEKYLAFLSVMKHASRFYDECIGGDGCIKLPFPPFGTGPYDPFPLELLSGRGGINWWKVLAIDCIGGCVGGPAGYAGASAISVISQL